MKILLAGGGTAGHINPALAIAGYIKEKEPSSEILFVGTKKGMESSLVPKSGYTIKYVEVEGLSKKLTIKNIRSLIHMITAKGKCKKIIKEFRPDVVIGTGGYVCAPAVMAANSLGVPTLIHEQNVFPGSAIKLLSKTSSVTAISFDDSRKYLADAKEIIFSGNPIRPSVLKSDRESARASLGLGEEKFLVIFGGSLGAAKINSVALAYIGSGMLPPECRVLFATGERNYNEVETMIGAENISVPENVEVVPYIHNMDEVMSASDLLVCRSGAITVSEISALGKPSVLVPSPNVTNNHQEYNARALSDSGAAITILEKDFNVESLASAVESVFGNDSFAMEMSKKSKEKGCVDALDIIYKKLKELI